MDRAEALPGSDSAKAGGRWRCRFAGLKPLSHTTHAPSTHRKPMASAQFGEDMADFNNLEGDDWIAEQRKKAASEAERAVPPTVAASPAPAAPVASAARPPGGSIVAPARPPMHPSGPQSIDAARSQALMQPSEWSRQREADAIAGRERMQRDREAYAAANPNARPIVTPARPTAGLTPAEIAGGSFIGPNPNTLPGTTIAKRADGTTSMTVSGQGGQPDASMRFANEKAAESYVPRMANRVQAKSAAEAFLDSRQPVATNSIVPPVPPAISGARPASPMPAQTAGASAAPSFEQMQREAVPVSPVAPAARPADPQFARMQAEAVPVSPVVAPAPRPRVVGGGAVARDVARVYEGSAPEIMAREATGKSARSPQAQLTTLRAQLKRTPEGPARQAIKRQIDQLSGIAIPVSVVPPARPVARGVVA